MPKIKKIRAAALTAKSVRHEPLGQAIQDDANRDKYAASRKNRRRSKPADDEDELQLMDPKSSEKILKMSKEQRLEMEAEVERRQRKSRQHHSERMPDSDEEEEEEEVSGLIDAEYDEEE